ncbi:hypothetical protein Hanom_Chr05g00443411 [Helianthus anomalus]
MQCIAARVGHFSWRKVTPIYEDQSTFNTSPGLLTLLSDALQLSKWSIQPSNGCYCFQAICYVTGFSIQVFEAGVKKLNYSLSYVFIPYNGTYDDLVAEVHNKV